MTKAVYRVTASAVPTVKVGSFLIDDDYGDRRDWGIYDPAAADFAVGFAGVRTDRVCSACYNLPARKVARKGHAELHGHAPRLIPTGAQDPAPAAPSPVELALGRIVNGWMPDIAVAAHRAARAVVDGRLTFDASDADVWAVVSDSAAEGVAWAAEGMAALRELAAGGLFDEDTGDGTGGVSVHPREDLAGTGFADVAALATALRALTPVQVAAAFLAAPVGHQDGVTAAGAPA